MAIEAIKKYSKAAVHADLPNQQLVKRPCTSGTGKEALVQRQLLFSPEVVSDSLQPHELQHARLPSPSLSPRVSSNSGPLSKWCQPTISSSVALFSSCPQSFLVSGFFHELALHTRWSKYWSLSFSISPSNEYSGLISFRLDWFDLALQETLKRVQEGASLLWHHNLKESILWCSAFFIVQLSHSNRTTGKTMALTIQTFVGKVLSLLFNTRSRFVIAFLPRSKCLLI